MIQRCRLVTTIFLSSCSLLQGCGSVKKTLGIDRDPPDEFAVNPSIQPLDMPPDFFVLPRPEPGTPRPQDAKEMDAKKEKLLGSSERPATSSPGQKALLELSGAEKGQDNIRQKVDEESRIESTKGKPILEKLGIKKSQPAGEVVNPHEETIELEKQGIPTNRMMPSE